MDRHKREQAIIDELCKSTFTSEFCANAFVSQLIHGKFCVKFSQDGAEVIGPEEMYKNENCEYETYDLDFSCVTNKETENDNRNIL